MALGVTLDELSSVYSVYFYTFKKYDENDLYDDLGQLCPSYHRESLGRLEFRNALAEHDGVSPIRITWEIDNGNATVTKTFYPPFKHVDRIEDYKTAYRVFSERLGLTQGE